MNWNKIVLKMRIMGRKYYNKGNFTRFYEIAKIASDIENACKLTYQKDISFIGR